MSRLPVIALAQAASSTGGCGRNRKSTSATISDSSDSRVCASGATVDQMHEAVHVAAALSAGIDLVHGVQMRNALAARGKL